MFVQLIQAVRERRGSGLVDDALDGEASQLTGTPRGTALRIVEIRRDRDDSVIDGFTERGFRNLLELFQHLGRYFLRRDSPAWNLDSQRSRSFGTNRIVHSQLLR